MPKELERDLGLYATITVSVGAMVGSGIFVLPGLAAKKAGPAVILAYLLAGLVVLPAALSKAEMATAMPDAGGTYLYIDRAMGPLAGTVAGVGAWFSLVFKSAFALVGLGAYLVLFAPLPTKPTALVLAVLLVGVNVAGVKQTGRLQAVVVTVVLGALALFILDGITYVNEPNYHPFFSTGAGGLLAATGFVFVSYAGVTKIASVAEEVEDPGRNIPIGMLGSVLVMMLVYTLVVFVVVGVIPVKEIGESLTPMADAAAAFAGPEGTVAVAIVAVLALLSMANAGVLSSSRFPFAMSRDDLAPAMLGDVHDRFQTPITAILATGALLLVLVAAVPVLELAKLASAFKILVFSLVNVALVAFRESDLASYDPDFVAPGYPWVQGFGVVAGGVLLTQMGSLAIGGAVGIIAMGVLWYRVYGRERTEREGAAIDAIRQSADRRTLRATEASLAGESDVLVALGEEMSDELVTHLLVTASAIAAQHDGRVNAARFEAVPEQVSLSSATEPTDADRAFEEHVEGVAETLPVPIEAESVVAHDVSRAVVNHAEAMDADLLLGPYAPDRLGPELLGTDIDWYMRHAPCETAFLYDRGIGTVDEVAVLATQGPAQPGKVRIADAIASQSGAAVRFLTAVDADATDDLVAATEAFHDDLAGLCASPASGEVVRTDDTVGGLVAAAAETDLAVIGTVPHSRTYELLVGDVADELADELGCTTLFVHGAGRDHTFLRAVIERLVY